MLDDFTFPEDTLFAFPADPNQRLYTAADLFDYAAHSVAKRQGIPAGGEVLVADIFDIITHAFETGALAPVLILN